MNRSDILRKSAGHDDAHCMLEIPFVHQHRHVGGCVLAHIPLAGNFGAGLKTDDTSATFACAGCHDALDGRTKGLTKHTQDWMYYALRGQQRTVAWWVEHGFLTIAKGRP